MELHLTTQELIAILQAIGLPILGLVWYSMRRIHRGNRLNGFKITALVHAMQFELKNGFSKSYETKLKQLMEDAKFVEDK